MTDVFSIIDQNDPHILQEFISNGGNISTRSAKGLSPLAYLCAHLVSLSSEERQVGEFDDEDDCSAVVSNCPALDTLSDSMRAASNMGIILIESGEDFLSRAGRTNRSIRVSDFVKNRFPLIFKDWSSAAQRQKIIRNINEEVDVESKSSTGPRKI